jgi:DNA-binding LacI/PurR family transcriptional regulator
MSLGDRPTAVFAANDLMALGVLWAASDYGLRVPEDLAIIGLDDIALAAEVRPALTTIALSQHDIGQIAMRMLLDLIALPHEPQNAPVFVETVSTQLVVRQSSV